MARKKKNPNYTVSAPSWITYLILIGSWWQYQEWKKKNPGPHPKDDPKDYFNLDLVWIAERISPYLKWQRKCTIKDLLPHVRYMATKSCDLLWCRTKDPQTAQDMYTYTKAGEKLVFELTGRDGEISEPLLDKRNISDWTGLVALVAFRLSVQDGNRKSKAKGLGLTEVQCLCAMTPGQFEKQGIPRIIDGFTVKKRRTSLHIQGKVTPVAEGKYQINGDLVFRGEQDLQDLMGQDPAPDPVTPKTTPPTVVFTKPGSPDPATDDEGDALIVFLGALGFSEEDIALCQSPSLVSHIKSQTRTWIDVRKEELEIRERRIRELEEKKERMAQQLASLEAELQSARGDGLRDFRSG